MRITFQFEDFRCIKFLFDEHAHHVMASLFFGNWIQLLLKWLSEIKKKLFFFWKSFIHLLMNDRNFIYWIAPIKNSLYKWFYKALPVIYTQVNAWIIQCIALNLVFIVNYSIFVHYIRYTLGSAHLIKHCVCVFNAHSALHAYCVNSV